MKKILTLAVAALTLCASLAMAAPAGINLYGFGSAGSGQCGDAAGLGATMTGTCGTIGTAMKLVSSVVVPRDIVDLAGVQQQIDVVTTSAAVPDYWRFDICRAGKAVATMNSTVPSNGTTCVATIWDYLSGSTIPLDGYNVDPTDPTKMQLNLGAGINGAPFQVPADGNELAVGSIQIGNGPAACAGCGVPACILLRWIKLGENGNPTPPIVSNASVSNFVTWIGNGAAPTPGFCPAATPTSNRTWGQLKSLYR